LAFRLRFQDRSLLVEVSSKEATYSLLEGSDLKIRHHGRALTVKSDSPATRAIPSIRPGDPPSQPPGRAPQRRRPKQ
jgi:alpha,alpha-trehalose phosphorylase